MCPCGSGAEYGACCGRFHEGELPERPEQLMRARYAAYARGRLDFVRETWHPGTRPDDLAPDPRIVWTGLEILDAPAPGGKRGVVEFRASWREGRESGEMRERSRFVWQSDRWWYLDGVVS